MGVCNSTVDAFEIYKIFSRTQHQSTQATYKGNSQALWVVYNNGISTVKAQEQ